ncbi:hypothetical protein BC628DRAFT_1420682 [Trametes gibbosa]|nr:hypothetical protein BC628DRAFT_1420682 [Trametes gibbosa]
MRALHAAATRDVDSTTKRDWKSVNNRELGTIFILLPLSFGASDSSERHTKEWGPQAFQADRSKFGSGFQGNVIDSRAVADFIPPVHYQSLNRVFRDFGHVIQGICAQFLPSRLR